MPVHGHGDNVPVKTKKFPTQAALSGARAAAIARHLVNKGFAAKNVSTLGHGDKDPIASNDSPEGRAKNRRIEIELKTE